MGFFRLDPKGKKTLTHVLIRPAATTTLSQGQDKNLDIEPLHILYALHYSQLLYISRLYHARPWFAWIANASLLLDYILIDVRAPFTSCRPLLLLLDLIESTRRERN